MEHKNCHSLLVEMQSLAVSYKLDVVLPYDSGISLLGICPIYLKTIFAQKKSACECLDQPYSQSPNTGSKQDSLQKANE